MTHRHFLPRPFRDFSSALSGFWDEEHWDLGATYPSGLSVYEKGDEVIVEASLPGISFEEIEVTYEKNILVIEGHKKKETEEKDKKYYRKASSSFSYRLMVPGNVDHEAEPDAVFANGVLKVIFKKRRGEGPKKIKVEHEK